MIKRHMLLAIIVCGIIMIGLSTVSAVDPTISNDSLNGSLANNSLANNTLSNSSSENDSLANNSLANNTLSNSSSENDSLNGSLANNSLANNTLSNGTSTNSTSNQTISTVSPIAPPIAPIIAPALSKIMKGYWMFFQDVARVSGRVLKSLGITDVFVLTRGVTGVYHYAELKLAIKKFHPYGIKVHAWIVCFKNGDPSRFVKPSNTSYRNRLIYRISYIAKKYNVDGIQLDYVRYSGVAKYHNAAWQQPGGVSAAVNTITSFVQRVRGKINAINRLHIKNKRHIKLSAAVMPEGSSNAYLYGQDYGRLSKYLDFFVPMVYKGNYKQNTRWITRAIRYIVRHARGKPVYAGLQTYHSDSNIARLSMAELNTDKRSAYAGGSLGYVLFRYGI